MSLKNFPYGSLFYAVSLWVTSQTVALAQVSVGQVPPVVKLEGDAGGRVSGGGWSSSELKDKMWILFYVDPDEKDLNDPTNQALKSEAFDLAKFGSVAVINMDATWVPNALINNTLQKKQEEFATTIYVKDMKKALVKLWGLGDDNSDIVLFDKIGKVLFRKDGKMSPEETKALIAMIKKNL